MKDEGVIMGKETSKRRIWIAIGVVVVILVVLLFFSDIQKVVDILLDADWVVLGLAALCMVGGMLLITTRWRYFLDNRPKFLPTLHADAISYTSKFFMPIPIPVLRVVNLAQTTSIDVSESTPAAVLNQTISFIMRLVALALTLLFLSRTPLSIWVILAGALFLLGLFGIVSWLVKNANKYLPRLTKLLARLPNMNEESLQGAMTNIQTGLSQVQSTRKLVVALLMSLVMWTFFLCFYALGFYALELGVNTREALAMASAALVIIPPSSPPMIGVYQGIMVAILAAFGILNLSESTAYAILVFVVMLLLWSVLALWGLRKENLRVSDVIHESRTGANVDTAPAEDPANS
jgi:uncharacterized protein (TIRG00374 family)